MGEEEGKGNAEGIRPRGGGADDDDDGLNTCTMRFGERVGP